MKAYVFMHGRGWIPADEVEILSVEEGFDGANIATFRIKGELIEHTGKVIKK